MATVYLAYDERHRRPVAVKVLRVELAAAIGRVRFQREIEVAASLSHAHILPLHDSGSAGDILYYVMPFVEGESLRERIRREGQLAIDEAIGITRAIATGLDYAHERGVIHRDIKPDNIMFSSGEPMLTDFGIALVMDAAGDDRLTETGLSLGTPAYMSPEQASGEAELDERSDVYSLACVLYEMLTGQPPFSGRNVRAIMARHVTDPVPPVATVRPSVSPGLERAIMIALAKVPVDRYATPGDFAKALEHSESVAEISPTRSVAVLPFDVLTVGEGQESFSEGLVEEIVSLLSRNAAFRVLARSSSSHLRAGHKSARLVGRELGVRYVLEGTVRGAEANVRINVQLVDTTSDVQVWSDRFTERLTDALEAQDRIASAVVDGVTTRLVPEHRPGAIAARNVHAHECYLRSRRDVWRFTEAGIINTLRYLQEALDIVGEDVLLYAGIAEAYYVFPLVAGHEPEACTERVEECAARIAELDSGSPHVDLFRGLLATRRPGGLAEALHHLQRAVDADVNDSTTIFWFGLRAAQAGLIEAAESAVERLMILDPRSPRSLWLAGWHHLMIGNLESAADGFSKSLDAGKENPQAMWYLAYVRALQRRPEDARAIAGQLQANHPDSAYAYIGKVYRYASQNWRKRALAAITPQLKSAARLSEAFSLHLAECLVLMGEHVQAAEWLENAIRRGFLNYAYLQQHTCLLDGMREQSRFQRLMDMVREESDGITGNVG